MPSLETPAHSLPAPNKSLPFPRALEQLWGDSWERREGMMTQGGFEAKTPVTDSFPLFMSRADQEMFKSGMPLSLQSHCNDQWQTEPLAEAFPSHVCSSPGQPVLLGTVGTGAVAAPKGSRIACKDAWCQTDFSVTKAEERYSLGGQASQICLSWQVSSGNNPWI